MRPIAIHACNAGPMPGSGNWTWLINGRRPTLIDAGIGSAKHLDAVEAVLDRVGLAQVLVTHGHDDHAAGAPSLAKRFPAVRFFKYAWSERDSHWPVPWHALDDGQRVQAGDVVLMALHTPGHSPDHVCFWHEETRTLWCGDLVASGAATWVPPFAGGDMAAYMKSLERVLALDVATLLPAHGPAIADPKRFLGTCVARGRVREQQVLAALRFGDASTRAITSRVYTGLRPSLFAAATQHVLAHLVKLEHDGLVRRTPDARWMLERSPSAPSTANMWHLSPSS